MAAARRERSRSADRRAGRSRASLLVAALALAAVVTAVVAATDRGPARPNVLLIVMDTTRADHCSVVGYARPTTPRLDEFARDAMVFRKAWSPANWTGPAHASLFTGLRPEHHGFHRGNHEFLDPQFETLAERLVSAGYVTAGYSNNECVAPEFGLTRGLQSFDRLYTAPDREYPWAAKTHEKAAQWAQAQSQAGHPFFLFINDMEPHLPYTPPRDVAAKFVRETPTAAELEQAYAYNYPQFLAFDTRCEELSQRQLDLLGDLYDAEIATLDASIGDLLDRLRTLGLLDSTLVVVVADHGENLGERHMLAHGYGLSATVCHVPLVVRWPGRFDKGRVVDEVVRLEDVLPTVLDVCGLPIPAGLDGVSLTHDVSGRIARAMDVPSPDIVTLHPGTAATALVRRVESVYDGQLHYVRHDDGSEELFDPRRDPAEEHDLSATERDDVRVLRAFLGR